MSDELKQVYTSANKSGRFYEGQTPVNLYRGQRADDSFDIMQPTLIGWVTSNGPRLPDILLNDSKGNSPQYVGGRPGGELVTESKKRPTTGQIVSDASAYTVKGCRTIRGDHRGVSVFDTTNPQLKNFDWYEIAAGTPIPEALAVTRDADRPIPGRATHYTIAPKDDMPLSLFLQHLKGMAAKAKKV
ncbi:MAG: hypothetical protein ABIR54_22505 [Burkholderiaceae bacterium]